MGTILYLKEPFYKIANTGEYIIRIDDPSEIVFEGSSEAKEIVGKEVQQVPDGKN